MKLKTSLKLEIDKIPNLGYVLDIGFSYPYELIEILHFCHPQKCVGVDLEKEEYAVSCSLVFTEIAKETNIDLDKIENLIRDDDFKREFHNSYKMYTSLVLNKNSIGFNQLKRSLELHFNKSIQDYLNNDNKWIQFYDVIIVSKILSHIDPTIKENGQWVLNELLKRLSDRGIIFLRLNSNDFVVEQNNGVSNSTILAPFNEQDLQSVLDKLNVISMETKTRDDGKREYEIIAKKKNKTSNNV